MPYSIVFLRDGRPLSRTPWDGNLEAAREHARDLLAKERVENQATSVQVVDTETRKHVYWYSGEESAEGTEACR